MQQISNQRIDDRLAALDLTLFDSLESQTSSRDRLALLALQRAIRAGGKAYTYLEIGSHRGGTLQPHWLDSACCKIYSIDKRPEVFADVRGMVRYVGNSTQRMVDDLNRLCTQPAGKLQTFDCDSSEVPRSAISPAPDFCFIDGEHTDAAAERDFDFCLSVVNPDGVIAFHDLNLVYYGIVRAIDKLRDAKVSYRAYILDSNVFVIQLGKSQIHRDAGIVDILANNHMGVLEALITQHPYRRFYYRRLFRWVRLLKRPFARPTTF